MNNNNNTTNTINNNNNNNNNGKVSRDKPFRSNTAPTTGTSPKTRLVYTYIYVYV